MIKMKKAFSLIEVIFVLMILGIVASISSQIIVQVYENYITQKALYKTTIKTEIAINQIINRLTFAIDGTTVTKNPNITPYNIGSRGTNWIKLNDIDVTNLNHRQFTTIEWIGYDNDSFSAAEAPYWSGVAKYDTAGGATRGSFETPGSTLNSVATIINNLSSGKVNLSNARPAAVIFSQQDNDYITGVDYDPSCMGLIETNNTDCIFPVRRGTLIATNDNNLTFTRNADANNVNLLPKIITERYKLAWSAYALVPEDEAPIGDGLFNLYLYSNYQPWNNETYTQYTDTSKKIKRKLLIPDISVFKFTENGGVIQLKLCATENIGKDFNISSCKEKAIIR